MALTHGLGIYGDGVGVVTPLDDRMWQIGVWTKTPTPNLIRAGLLYNGTSTIVSGKANMSYDVAPFAAVSTRGATQGAVPFSNGATENIATDVLGNPLVAPGSNSAYHVVFAWQRDFALDGINSDPVLGVIQGSSAPSPSVPSLSSYPGAIELARILVPAGVTATNSGTTITQTAPFTTVDGGTLVFRTTTDMNLYTPLKTGDLALCLANNVVYRWSGSAWKEWESDWITWTTAPTNLAVGTGGSASSSQRYRWINGRALFKCKYVLGSSGASVSDSPVINLPFSLAPLTTRFAALDGSGSIYDLSTTTAYFVRARINVTTADQVVISQFTGSYVAISSSSPMTWASGDELGVEFWGDPA